jgi:triacylglycerol lipase
MMQFRLAAGRAAVVAGLLLASLSFANATQPTSVPQLAQRTAELAAQVTAAEDLRAIKRLQRTYGYYLDKGMWTDLAEYFTDDAVANYPAGVFVGKKSIREHLYLNVGNVKLGEVGLGNKRLYNHMNIQPVVHLDPGGQTAKGRWRALAFFGSYGGPAGTWAEGVYEMQYAKHNGVWKISKLDYHSGFGASYATGWGYIAPPAAGPAAAAAAPASRARRQLAHPADIERHMDCEGFPAACLAPFHYANPSALSGGLAWDPASLPVTPIKGDVKRALAELVRRTDRLEDEAQIENLQRIYGYYLDRAQWDQVADLFADDGTVEFAQQGVYVGKPRVRAFLGRLGHHGLEAGWLNDHMQLQEVVDVAADGRSAVARSRELDLTARYGKSGQWSEGLYENAYVKDHGVWKFKSVHFFPTFITDYDKGWTQDAQPAPGIDPALPPDRPPSQVYEIFPKAHVPPYHYRNPVTGSAPTYPAVGGPDAKLAAAALFHAGKPAALKPVRDAAATLAETQRRLERFKDYHELENLESAYGYYLDKNLWTDLADLFAKDGSIELAQRGVYKGARVRSFLKTVFGRGEEGPVAGRLGNHIQMQPVIHVDADGRSAKIRVRMLQQMGMGGRSSIGGAVYENEAVKEDGVWKFRVDHTYNTFSASYVGGPAKAAGRFMPGPMAGFDWDAPPTTFTAMFPIVYEIPYHYANPVSGRTELPPLPSVQEQLVLYPMPPPAPPAAKLPKPVGMPDAIAAALRDIGPRIEGAKTTALYAPLQPKEPYTGVKLLRDVAYGPHERHRMDVFTPPDAGQGRAILVFIHGGGFNRGAKSAPGSPFYDNIGLWAASQGLVGVTINYRYAPQFPYPAGVEDLARVVAYLKAHAKQYGGDPNRIFLWGHSAGGAHAADYIVRTAKPGIAGAILTSGIYTLGDKVSIWKDYYGDDVAKYKERESLPGLARTSVPLMVTYGELDPESFVADAEALIRARCQNGLPLKQLRVVNHSHISETYAVGSGDESLSAPVLQFIRSTAAAH